MARFLLDADYASIIQSADLTQITEGVALNLQQSEEKAISRMRTKLVQRYMVDIELGTMTTYSASTYYKTKQRILDAFGVIYSVLEFDRYSSTTAYLTGDIVSDPDGYVYTALSDNTGVALTSTTVWERLIATPPTDAPTSLGLWSSATAYVVGNVVNTSEGLYYISIQNGTNHAVTDAAYWTLVTVTVDSTYWQQLDNRYPLFVEVAMDLALYNLYARINPRNIPELRKERNREALDQLDAWGSGTDTAEVLTVDDAEQTGYSIRYGSALPKQNNFFL